MCSVYLFKFLAIEVVEFERDELAHLHVTHCFQQGQQLPGALQSVERSLYRTEVYNMGINNEGQ